MSFNIIYFHHQYIEQADIRISKLVFERALLDKSLVMGAETVLTEAGLWPHPAHFNWTDLGESITKKMGVVICEFFLFYLIFTLSYIYLILFQLFLFLRFWKSKVCRAPKKPKNSNLIAGSLEVIFSVK